MKTILRMAMLLITVFTYTGCKHRTFDSEPALWAYVKDPENKYSFEKKIGNVSYTLTLRPTDILVKQEAGENFTLTQIDSLRRKYGRYLYFNLSMSADNRELLSSKAGDRNTFGAMVNELAFGMAEKVHLISQKRDTIPMADYIYPRMYGMSNSTNMLMVYPRDNQLMENEYFHLTVEDLGFSTGEVGFRIPAEKIKDEPRLKFRNTL